MTITATTQVFAVMGNPVRHSLSPVMFNRAFAETGYNAVYAAFEVTSIQDAVNAVRSLGIQGVSITIPHKVTVLEFLDEVDPLAAEIGAVNTIINRNGRLIGFNSDSLGAVKAIEEVTRLDGKRIVILGAGGAARAIGFGVQAKGAGVTIVNRSIANGETLAKALNADFTPLQDLHRLDADILINTTSVGMTPDSLRSPVDDIVFRPGMLVMDVVYAPLHTRFLQQARNAGCMTINGLSMLVHQAAFQFELWTGLPAPTGVMQQSLTTGLNFAGGEDSPS
jgi:shikimate dehydrogenase